MDAEYVNEVLFPGSLVAPEDVDDDAALQHADDVEELLTTAASSSRERLVLRPWQRDALLPTLAALEKPGTPVLINAAVGTGKTLIAEAVMISKLYGNTAYMAKVLFATPLVDLAVEQHAVFELWARNLNISLPSRTRIAVALRAGAHPVGDLRRSSIVVCTYEIARLLLADANAPLYPDSQRLHRTWGQAWQAVIVDEVHNLMGERGPVISCILALAVHHESPILMMTGTPHATMCSSLQKYFSNQMRIVRSGAEDMCQQAVVRVPDGKTFSSALVGLFVLNVIAPNGGRDGTVVFARKITDVYKHFRDICSDIKEYLEHLPPDTPPDRRAKLDDARRLFLPTQVEPGPDYDVTWSGVAPDNRLPAEHLASERKMARDMLRLGIGYYWRDIGPRYSRLIFMALARGRMRILVTTSKLAAGVNLPGIRHVAIFNAGPNLAELAQMIGRCGRRTIGWAFLLCMDPPTPEQITESITPPSPTVARELTFWWILKKAYAARLTIPQNIGRWEWSVDAWKTFLRRIPMPCIRQEDAATQIDQALQFLMGTLGVCNENVRHELVVFASPETLRISEGNAEVIGIALHVVEVAARLGILPASRGVPWLIALGYWATKEDRLPTITWGKRKRDLSTMVDAPYKTPSMFNLLGEIGEQAGAILRAVSSTGTLFHGAQPWVITNLICLTQLTAFALTGLDVGYSSFVPRSTLSQVIPGLVQATALLDEMATFLKISPVIKYSLLDWPAMVVNAAGRMVAKATGVAVPVDLVTEARTPLELVASEAQWAHHGEDQIVGWLEGDAQALPVGFFPSALDAFPADWRASLGVVHRQGAPQVRARRLPDDSD
jgi:hypothetical protein